ncbi:MAG TPA: protein translocase subunit SecD, partial [Planctomycetota bacterium]|nr:protein translocase subunit SecD [Planctomycetota bacterium]
KPRLIELIAINMKEQFFKGEDLEPSGVHAGMSSDGTPSVNYKIKDARSGDYAEWSQKWIKHHSAIILNNVVKSAPVFQSRIPGSGEIHGDFTQAEVEELVKVLRTGSLRVEPQFESLSQIGATLGQDSIRRGVTSLLAGSLAVFAFMLVYYRLSGLVACITLLLNVALLYAAMLFTESTITLPGLGGIVLTMGMAVDANILIYERIREEIDRGKDLLRATRAGFERAMVVILDANLTTFLSGLVLYDVGVGPVRGFAVTLMWGIVTTLFTQFFVTRLLFHFLIDRKILTEYRMKRWLTGFNVDFVRYIKGWLVLSGAVIVFGIVYAGFVVPTDKLLGMDFTGGANLQMALEQPTGAEVIRTELAKDPGFHSRFPNPTVNTIGEVADNKATHFNIRVKLDEALRHQIEQERRDYSQRKLDAAAKGEPLPPPYEPPYLVDLRRIFAGQLVQPAYSDATVATLPNGMGAASIVLHFQKPVAIAEVKRVLEEAKFPPPSVTGKDGETVVETKDVWVQWTTTANTLPSQLFERVRDPLIAQKDKDGPTALKDTAGKSIELSDPFPEAAEMAGRIVSELRNAAIGALILAWVMILFYLRVRFHEYKFGIAAIVALLHDVSVTFAVVVVANHLGLVHAELDLNMIACFLTIIGYSVNDTIVVFDRIRENIQEQARTGEREPFPHLINRSINQTLSRTVLTSGVTMFCVLAQFLVNWGSDSDLESFAFAMTFGIITGTYSSIYIAAPILIMMRGHELAGGSHPGPTGDQPATPVPVQTAG